MKGRTVFILTSLFFITLIILWAQFNPKVYWTFLILTPIIMLGISDMLNRKQSIKRNFPVIGHFRFLLEKMRPEIQQYFVETDTEGTPINRIFRSLIYQRSKNVTDTTPFGTRLNVYKSGYEWMNHSMFAIDHHKIEHDPRVIVGGENCRQPYAASILNISAMSFGSLSKNAVMAMNKGAKIGGFAQNTGEGGISHYHLEHGGDLIWQIGTGYFGCRTKEGAFDPEMFAINSAKTSVKMIELKISQGAKPGHGGILPAIKNTKEIAEIRGVEAHTTVFSPPSHATFDDTNGLLDFISQLQELSGGKPVGFKICVGSRNEFEEICTSMKEKQIYPDFISVDGGEGGTGAAPVEFSNSLGMPLRDGIYIVDTLLKKHGLRGKLKIIASGKIFTSFHMARVIALGADLCYSARAMMLATGCIQALQCNNNTCPVGVATQNKHLMKGLDVDIKSERVASYHRKTVEAFAELLGAAGLLSSDEITKDHINKRVSITSVKTYAEIYPG